MGIDIIASGHMHEKTESVLTQSYNDNPEVWTTRIICAGKYGENLAQLDVTFTVGAGVDTAVLTNNTIDKNVPQADTVRLYMVGALDTAINEAIGAKGLPNINSVPYTLSPPLVVSAVKIDLSTDSDNLGQPSGATETGMGNLVADSYRFCLESLNSPAIGIVANGVIRNGFDLNQKISFADIYNTLPLGGSLHSADQGIPGYPLLIIWLDETSIQNLCQLDALIIQDCNTGAYGHQLVSDYYLNLSGLRYTYASVGGVYAVTGATVYGATDYSCHGASAPLHTVATQMVATGGLIPCVVDLYTALVFLSEDMADILDAFHLTISPKVMVNSAFEDLALSNILAHGSTEFVIKDDMEVKGWMALLNYVNTVLLNDVPFIFYSSTDSTSTTDLPYIHLIIPDAYYGAEETASGNGSRVNGP